jgi:FKBP-type peptidyl-prolyl cis-trans isomerase
MKKIFIVLFTLCFHGLIAQIAQQVDYNKIILPATADSVNIAEKLVQLAWQNYPLNEVAELGVASAKKAVTMSKLDLLNNVSGTFNANDFTVQNGLFTPQKQALDANGNPVVGAYFYPRYNVSVRLSIGDIILTPMKVSKNKLQVKVTEAQVRAQKLNIRAEMLRRYQVYLTSIEVLKLRVKAVEEAHLIHLLVTKKFKKGEAILEDYNKSFLTFNNAQEAKVTAEGQVYLTKNSIEEMIGLKLEEVTGTKYDTQRIDKKGDTTITASGLKYVVIEPGFGEKPKSGQTVKVFYTGKFMNGKEFENNLKDDPFRITLGVQQVIQGWEEGILLMHEGEKGTLIIPSRLAYGHQGIKDPSNEGAYLVPPDTPVIYDIELVDVK